MAAECKSWKLYEQRYKGKWVRVSTDGISIIGILTEADYEKITLQPFIQHETIGSDNKDLELRLDDTPITISMPIKVISSMNYEFVKELLRRYPIKYNVSQEELPL